MVSLTMVPWMVWHGMVWYKQQQKESSVCVSQHNYVSTREWNTEGTKEGTIGSFATLCLSLSSLHSRIVAIGHTPPSREKKKRKEGGKIRGSEERGGRRNKCECLRDDSAEQRTDIKTA